MPGRPVESLFRSCSAFTGSGLGVFGRSASVAAVARRLGVDWHTVWDAIKPLLAELADDPARLVGIDTLGVDEHIVAQHRCTRLESFEPDPLRGHIRRSAEGEAARIWRSRDNTDASGLLHQ